MNVLFSSLDELVESINAMGRDAFVAEIAGNPEKYRSIPDPSRKSKKGDNDGVIYLLTNLANKKIYVGQTKNFDNRMRLHLGGNGRAIGVTNAIAKYGRENFMTVVLLAGIQQQEERDLVEIVTIKTLDCLAPGGRGYNIHPGGRGGEPSEETRKKISATLTGKKRSLSDRAAMSARMKGKSLSEETRNKISSVMTGKKRGPYHISEKIRAAMSARMKGKSLSEETRKKIGYSQRGRTFSEETRKKIGDSQRGRTFSDETRKKMRDARIGRTFSDEARKKMGDSHRGKTLSDETRKKIGDKSRGRTHSDETRKKMRGMHARAVVITLVETREELVFESCGLAANAMGVCQTSISRLAIGKRTKSKSKGGEYKNAYFTARYRDLPGARSRRPPSKDSLAKLFKAVVITLVATGEEIVFDSVKTAAKAMGKSSSSISNLANKTPGVFKNGLSLCEGGAYAGQFITARFRDLPYTDKSRHESEDSRP